MASVGGQCDSVLVVGFGGPTRPEEIRPFLDNVLRGRPVPRERYEEVVRHYESSGGRSPYNELTLRQTDALRADLSHRGITVPIEVGMRNWEPYIRDVVPQMVSAGVERAVAICLAPHASRTSVGLYRKALFGALERPDDKCPEQVSGKPALPFACEFVESWHDHPLLIEAFADKFRAGYALACGGAGGAVPVIFTAHSVPTRTVTEGDPYERQTRETAKLVAGAVGLRDDESTFAFQSQGMSGGPWLGPTVEETIESLKAKGAKGVFIQPIGFLCDHVEVLYDIDIAFKKFAEEHGMKLWRAGSLNDSPILSRAIADVARRALSRG